jgi:hypothetical protein
VNGTAPNIEILKPFSEAVELTKQILFRPFDLKKWFIIGFAAWLMHIGGGYNFSYNYNQRSDVHKIPALNQFTETIHRIPHPVLIIALLSIFVLIVGLIVLFVWLRSRGRFVFTDCIVRNRAAIAEPWREFRRQGNSFFLLSLLVGLGLLTIAAALAAPVAVILFQGRATHHGHHFFLISGILLWIAAIFVMAIAWTLIAHFMTPIMYRRRCLAGEGFRAAVSLITSYPGEITLYCLFFIALGIGTAIVACAAMCLTCCLAALPYIGTVILLPVYTCLHAFALLFVRQFGNDYDAWAAITPAGPPEALPLPTS